MSSPPIPQGRRVVHQSARSWQSILGVAGHYAPGGYGWPGRANETSFAHSVWYTIISAHPKAPRATTRTHSSKRQGKQAPSQGEISPKLEPSDSSRLRKVGLRQRTNNVQHATFPNSRQLHRRCGRWPLPPPQVGHWPGGRSVESRPSGRLR